MSYVMEAAGVLSDEEAPPIPEWHEEVEQGERLELFEDAIHDPAYESLLDATDRALVLARRAADAEHRRTRSVQVGKVPLFKFMSNDRWIVDAEECAIIDARLRPLGASFDHRAVARVEEQRQKSRSAALEELQRSGLSGRGLSATTDPLELTLDEWRLWILDWSDFNVLACEGGGYTVT